MIKAAIFGYGNIGSGVAIVLDQNREEILKRTGLDMELKYILDLKDFPDSRYADKIIHDIDIIINDPEVQICCETMGGKKAAYEFTKKALEAGKSVCTSNKELVEAYGPELIEIAKAHNCSYLFEASVGGGIPIIRGINHCLTADKIESVTGILNGTTNYMLTKMAAEGADYEDVLKEAQDLGYAERNPEADVDGHDAGRKIAILSSLMCGKTVSYNDLLVEGISKITKEDFLYARKLGMSIKLLGFGASTPMGVYAMVAPFLLGPGHPLYMVNEVYNGILVHGNMVGDVMFYGAGAGKLPTASAVCADAVALASNLGRHIEVKWSKEPADMISVDGQKRKFLVRMKAENKNNVSELFGAVEYIDIDSLPQEYAFITPEISEKEFADKYAALQGAISRIRFA